MPSFGIVTWSTLWKWSTLARKLLPVCIFFRLAAILDNSFDLVFQVMYIPAVPLTPQNQKYIERQKETFLRGQRPPDFPQGMGEDKFIGVAGADDIMAPIGRRAMGFQVAVV